MAPPLQYPGAEDLRHAGEQLAARVPAPLAPLARIAFNYRWSWMRGGAELFQAVDAHRWALCLRNPVRLLQEAPTGLLERAAGDAALCARARALEAELAAELAAPSSGELPDQRPVAFFCSEYGVHPSLPIYAGGLGVLAGDLLKAASDAGLPLVGVGLLYQQGYFRQRIDTSGWQHEYWVPTDPARLPAALVTRGGEPVVVVVPVRGVPVVTQVWRVDVGRVPLYLLDTDRPENRPIDRWIAARLYVGDLDMRLAQYAVLGRGGVRALHALGIEPSVLHLNEGHAGLAPLELAAAEVAAGRTLAEAVAAARARTVFTTHTPVPAGNETYTPEQLQRAHPDFADRLSTDWETLLALAREDHGAIGMTQFALRMSRAVNAVSRRHGEVARPMWRRTFGSASDAEVPIGHVTNGVHVGTWMAAPMRALLDRHLGPGWEASADPATWQKVDAIPDAELWETRRRLRSALVEEVRERATLDRLARGETRAYVELAARAFDPERLTVGFARRLATYKRMHLLMRDLPRALRLLDGPRPIQILLAGKAHPQDEEAKRIVQVLFQAKGQGHVGERIAYLHDYDMELASHLVAGCDLWLNLPRPPFEASGTSGMKAALNGGLNLSVLDGWWPEAFDGSNGWAVEGAESRDPEAQDARHAKAVLDILEREVVPLFYDRDADGIPRGWAQRIKASLRTVGLRFSARRMLADYVTKAYRAGAGAGGAAS